MMYLMRGFLKKEKLHMNFDGSTDVFGAVLTNVNLLYIVPIAFGFFY